MQAESEQCCCLFQGICGRRLEIVGQEHNCTAFPGSGNPAGLELGLTTLPVFSSPSTMTSSVRSAIRTIEADVIPGCTGADLYWHLSTALDTDGLAGMDTLSR
jgi:hypothetical protein